MNSKWDINKFFKDSDFGLHYAKIDFGSAKKTALLS